MNLFMLVRTVLISDVQTFLVPQMTSVRLLKLAGWRKLLQKGKKQLIHNVYVFYDFSDILRLCLYFCYL